VGTAADMLITLEEEMKTKINRRSRALAEDHVGWLYSATKEFFSIS
jgi:hypothetical protein